MATALSLLIAGLAPAGVASGHAASPIGATGLARAAGPTSVVQYRVNAGGPAIVDSPNWEADTSGAPNAHLTTPTSTVINKTRVSVDMTDPSIPIGTPMALFQRNRSTDTKMTWKFAVVPGQYLVKLFFAEITNQAAGSRVMDVTANGAAVLTNFDVAAAAGESTALMESSAVAVSSGTKDIKLIFTTVKGAAQVSAIEIDSTAPNMLGFSVGDLAFGSVTTGQNNTLPVTLTNLGGAGDPPITVTSATTSGTDALQFSADFPNNRVPYPITRCPWAGPCQPYNLTLAPQQSTTVQVSFAAASGPRSGTLNVVSSAADSPVTLPLSGTGTKDIGFSKRPLSGTSSKSATVVRWGPDNRLYVAEFDGLIRAYTVARSSGGQYSVTATETISVVNQIPNHDDNGRLNPTVNSRLITGMLLTGTAGNPVIYVSSSDPRIGGGLNGTKTKVDTNSGVISELTLSGGTWQRLDLVRGLPRSEENHATNGLALDPTTNTLYVGQGGNTNMGAPSSAFDYLPEYAYSGAILSVNLTAIGTSTYDLPTLVDDNPALNTSVFGGDKGRHQAKLTPTSPVQIYMAGFRNPYDLVLTSKGRLYANDNGANAGWGNIAVGAGTGGTCTNAASNGGRTDLDALHLITQGGYAGHPNPTRANQANTFNTTHPQSPVNVADPIQCDYIRPGKQASVTNSLTTFDGSTDGIVEYPASNFGGALQGDLLLANYSRGGVYDVKLDSAGTNVVSNQVLFANVALLPLSLTVVGDTGPFPGTIWVADFASGGILVFEPDDYGGVVPPSCTGVYSTSLDEDGDGYSNADEIDNHTNPCSSASVPLDWDHANPDEPPGQLISDLHDPDVDNDGPADTADPFAVDPNHGTTTNLPVNYTWANGTSAGGLFDFGFTGLMTDGNTDYQQLYDTTNMTIGGAAGVLSIDKVPPGDATTSTQEYGFQFGINVNSGTGPFTAHTQMEAPFAGLTPQGSQSMGLYLGTGDQSNYIKIVTSANQGSPGVEVVQEVNGVTSSEPVSAVAMPGPDAVDLYLTVDPAADTVQPSYRVITGGVAGAIVQIGAPLSIPAGWLAHTYNGPCSPDWSGPCASPLGMAVGIISTSLGGGQFAATWKGISVLLGQPS